MLGDSVDLKHVLRQVDANSRKLHNGRRFSIQVVDQPLHFGTLMPLRVGAFIPLLTFNEYKIEESSHRFSLLLPSA